MNPELKEFFELNKYFLIGVDCVGDCLLEAKNTQDNLFKIIEIKHKIEKQLRKAERDFEVFVAEHRDQIVRICEKNSVRPTANLVEDRMIRHNSEDYQTKKQAVDDARLDYEMVQSLTMAMFQRKDLIVEAINLLRFKQESEGCLLKNKEIVKKLGLLAA